MPLTISLEQPDDLLRWIAAGAGRLELDDLEGVDIWGLVALAALCREPGEPGVDVTVGSGGASRFAHAVGFRELTNGTSSTARAEPARTVPLRALDAFPRPRLLEFSNMPVATQSYLHALLFEVIRLAWAKRVPIFVVGAGPAVRSSLELLEQYALGG